MQPAGDGTGKFFIKPDSIDPGPAPSTHPVNGGSINVSNSQNARLHNSFVQGGRGNDIILAGQGRDEIEGGIGDDFIDGGSESEFLSKFVGATAAATKVKLEDPETGTPGIYSIYADGSKNWAWDGEQDNPSYFEVALTDGEYGIKLAEDGFDFNSFNNDRFNSYDVAFYNGAQVRYDISEVYLKLDAGRPDLKSDGSYQVLTTDAYATAAVVDKIGYKKVVKVDDLLPAIAGGEGTDYLLNIEAIRFHDEDMDGEVQLEQDSWYFANEMPVSDWAWSPASDATSSGTITAYTSHWGGSQTKWNDAATWNLYTYNVDQGISAVYEENTSEWIVTFVQSDGSGGYQETYDNTDWSFTPASDAVVVASIDTYSTEWGGTNDKWNDNSDWNLYETGTAGVYAIYETETYGWLQGFVQSDGSGGYKEATQISYEGGTNGTIRDDVIVSPNREQKDQIFGKEGDDLIDAGKAIDRIKGGAGDDVIWGGANVAAQSHNVSGSEASSYIEGDVAYYSSAQDQYTVVRNVYVKAAAVGGDVDRDASGRAEIYGDGAIAAKGVVVATTSDELTEANGYHAATIVIDRLTDAAGGEGVDVLIGIEGLAFGATDNFYLQDFSHPGGAHPGGPTLSSLEISAYGQTTYHDYFKPGQGWQWVESGGAVYTGTAYDDTIRFDTLNVFEDNYGGSDLRGSDIDEYVFLGEAGDDIIIGNSSADVKGTAVYKGPANEYTVSYDAASKEATVTHNISAMQGGTGVDTLKNIDKIVFNFNANDYFYSADGPAQGGKVDPNVVNLLATTQTVKNRCKMRL